MQKNKLLQSIKTSHDIVRDDRERYKEGGTTGFGMKGVFQHLPLEYIAVQEQIRTNINETDEEFLNLVESIRKNGLIQPVVVKRTEAANSYRLIAGERRLRAARIVGLAAIPAVVHADDVKDEEAFLWQLSENLLRQDMTFYDKTMAFKKLLAFVYQADDKADMRQLVSNFLSELINTDTKGDTVTVPVDTLKDYGMSPSSVAKYVRALLFTDGFLAVLKTVPDVQIRLIDALYPLRETEAAEEILTQYRDRKLTLIQVQKLVSQAKESAKAPKQRIRAFGMLKGLCDKLTPLATGEISIKDREKSLAQIAEMKALLEQIEETLQK